jgi:FkbM family methyltransferase
MLSLARYALEKTVNRHRFNDSLLYAIYLRLRYPSYVQLKRAEHAFYRSVLGSYPLKLIFDIGANGGSKTILFLRRAEKVISVEPSPEAASILKQRFAENTRVHVVEKGVDSSTGNARFFLFDDADAYNTFSQKWVDTLAKDKARNNRPAKIAKYVLNVQMTTLDELIAEFGLPDYVKIDVEGYEVRAIRGLSHKVPLLSFECNLPEFGEDAVEIVRKLSSQDKSTRFNFVVTEPPTRFENQEWMDADGMIEVIGKSKLSYMEIYSRAGREHR